MRAYRLAGLVLVGVLLVAQPRRVLSSEGLTPYVPGATTGVPVGALPPPGLYGSNDNYVVFGQVRDGNGNRIPIKVTNWSTNLSLLYASPFRILGAQYGAGIVEILADHQVDSTDVGGRATGSVGLFNTILEPLVLSWTLKPDLFVSIGQSFYLPDGEYHQVAGVRSQTAYANGYWTYEPSFAISYLSKGWDFTATNIYDVNSENHQTHYRSGDLYYLDLTAVKTIGGLSAGLIGNYTQQTGDDKHEGATVGDGNRVQHVMLGPLLAYKFGRFQLTGRFLSDVRTRNDVKISEFHVSISTSF